MADKMDLARIARLAGNEGSPQASVLVPDVRSGTTFTYAGTGELVDPYPYYRVVWIYTVEPKDRVNFSALIQTYEADPNNLPAASTEISYGGTYTVSISSAAPDFEYRTLWGLTDLDKIKALNDYLHKAGADLKNVLALISPRPALRAEIMGLTRLSAP